MKCLSESTSYCLGMSLTIEALKNRPDCLDEIVLSLKAHKNSQLDYLLKLADDNKINVLYDDRIIEKYSLKENCYCIGFFHHFFSPLKSKQHIVLYEFDDYGQLGTVLRSAISFDFHDIVLIHTAIDYFDPRAIRASMGAVFHLNIVRYDSLEAYMKDYPMNCYIFLDEASKELKSLIPEAPYCLVIPSDETKLLEYKKEAYYIRHHFDALPLSATASIVFNYCFEKRKR